MEEQAKSVENLCRLLISCDARYESALMCAVLDEIEESADPMAVPYVRELAESWAIWKIARPLRRRARRCLIALQSELSRRTAAQTLLRGSELPAEMMVRPAHTKAESLMLVRPAS